MSSINLQPERDTLLTDLARDLLAGFYLHEGESFQEGFARPALGFCEGDLEFAQKIYDDVSKGWAMYSSPIFSNAVLEGGPSKSQPISCFLSYVENKRRGLVEHQKELAWLSMLGGGVGGHWSDIESVTDRSVGPLPHIKITDAAVEAFRQGKTRKGSYAAYLDVSHPDIQEFLYMRTPTGGDVNRKTFNIHLAVNLTHDFMWSCIHDRDWNLVDPSTGVVRDSVRARDLFEAIIETRFRTGEPYLNFIDTANEALPELLKAMGLRVHGSNLCNEIHLPTSADRTAVCCLSSINVAKYDEWRHDPEFIGRWVRFLDNVLTHFIETAPDQMGKAIKSAARERSIGLGQMGFHHLLQSRDLAWESSEARELNLEVSQLIHAKAEEETFRLAEERGEAPDMAGSGRRNAHLIAIAPNANSGLICGTSPSIEPLRSNAYTQSSRAGSHLVVNPHLRRILSKYKPGEFFLKVTGETGDEWLERQVRDVVLNSGSVQHLPYLSDHDKDVLKTAFELDAEWTVDHAADRQRYVCQGQSVNLYFPKGTPRRHVLKVHFKAWARGLKGLYYLRTESGFKGDAVSSSMNRRALLNHNETEQKEEEECLACQG